MNRVRPITVQPNLPERHIAPQLVGASAHAYKTDSKTLPKGWRWVKLGEMCEINPPRLEIDRGTGGRE